MMTVNQFQNIEWGNDWNISLLDRWRQLPQVDANDFNSNWFYKLPVLYWIQKLQVAFCTTPVLNTVIQAGYSVVVPVYTKPFKPFPQAFVAYDRDSVAIFSGTQIAKAFD